MSENLRSSWSEDLMRVNELGRVSTVWRLFTWSGVRAVAGVRSADFLFNRGWAHLAHLVSSLNVMINGADIAVGAHIGGGLKIAHSVGVVIGRQVQIGANCTLAGACVIGSRDIDGGDRSGQPVLGDRVVIGAGAAVLGSVQIGHDARIGAGAVVLRDVPAGATAVGNPARVILP